MKTAAVIQKRCDIDRLIELKRAQMRDTLYNCSVDCTRSAEHVTYGRGVFVGVAGTIMSFMGVDLDEALQIMKRIIDGRFEINQACIPNCWLGDWSK